MVSGAVDDGVAEALAMTGERPVPLDVLLVVDDELVAGDLSRQLLAQGAGVRLFRDGEHALAAARRRPPDLILVELDLPVVTGFEVTRRLRIDGPTARVPIVALASREHARSRAAAFAAGADCVLAEPLEGLELCAVLSSLGHRGRERRSLEDCDAVYDALVEVAELRAPGHGERVGRMARQLARALDLPAGEATVLARAGRLHDIGHVGSPVALLGREHDLADDERALMEMHPLLGTRICGRLTTLAPVLPLIRHHHERLDGSGYPDGLAGDAIPFGAQALAVVDVFDDLVCGRDARPAHSVEGALAVLADEARRGLFRVELVARLAGVVREQGVRA